MTTKKSSRRVAGAVVAPALALAVCAGSANAQVWTVNSLADNSISEGFTNDFMGPPCHILSPPGAFGPSPTGGVESRTLAECGFLVVTCPLIGGGRTAIMIQGIGSPLLDITWVSAAWANHSCHDRPTYHAYGIGDLNTDLDFNIGGIPVGTPVNVFHAHDQYSIAWSESEAGAEDNAQVLNTGAFIDGVAQYPPGALDINQIGFQTNAGSGGFGALGGDSVVVKLTERILAEIRNPGKGPANDDTASGYSKGQMYLALNGPPPPFPQIPDLDGDGIPEFEFSLDIGSDTELSDPLADGDESFDPGDVYFWMGPPSGPFNGIHDDLILFGGFDPAPTPGVAGSAAPTCTAIGPGQVQDDYFDLDGHDSLDFSLQQFVNPDGPNPNPIPRPDMPDSNCIFTSEHLMFSFDDDGADHYVGSGLFCQVPVLSLSPLGGLYGTTGGIDEVMGLALMPTFPATVAASYPVMTEEKLHRQLAPNPDTTERDDDDTDSLDAIGTGIDCPNFYFTADHEARVGLDPGDIFEAFAGGGFTTVIDRAAHLGLPLGTDVDAFEFAWTRTQGGTEVFTVLFSVDDDDPLTLPDESGGLMPGMIYASYLTGFSFPYLNQPLWDDIDALTAWAQPVPTFNPTPTPCPGDCNGDGVVDINDLNLVLGNFGTGGPAGDCNGDGTVDINDLNLVLGNFGTICP